MGNNAGRLQLVCPSEGETPVKAKTAAFSILELLLAVAVVGVLVAAGFLVMPRDRLAVRQAAEGLARDVQLARFQAISRNTYVVVDVRPADNGYRIMERDSGVVLKSVSFADGGRTARAAILGVNNEANDIVFDPRGIGIGPGPQSVVIGSPSSGYSVTVAISQPGRVTIQ